MFVLPPAKWIIILPAGSVNISKLKKTFVKVYKKLKIHISYLYLTHTKRVGSLYITKPFKYIYAELGRLLTYRCLLLITDYMMKPVI